MNGPRDTRYEARTRRLRTWLADGIEELPNGDELPTQVRTDVLSRLSSTPQRRRWWPLRWFPFGIGATRSADSAEPRSEGRNRSMFNATRIAAAVAILALGGTLVFVAGPLAPDRELSVAPAAEIAPIDPADFGGFSGSWTADTCITCEIVAGARTTDWGSVVSDETYSSDLDASDPRISGVMHSIHNYSNFTQRTDAEESGGVVHAAEFVVEADEGTWKGPSTGYFNPATGVMHFEAVLSGDGAYDGLTALMTLSQDEFSRTFDVDGVIFPGALPETPTWEPGE